MPSQWGRPVRSAISRRCTRCSRRRVCRWNCRACGRRRWRSVPTVGSWPPRARRRRLVLIDPHNGRIRQRVALPSNEALDLNDVSSHLLKPDKSGQLSYTGLIFSPDGTRIYLSNVNGDVKVFRVGPAGLVSGLPPIALPLANAPWRKEEIPRGIGNLSRRSTAVRRVEPVQSPGGDRYRDRRGAAALAGGLRAVRTSLWSATKRT